jgi:hypothetical protein
LDAAQGALCGAQAGAGRAHVLGRREVQADPGEIGSRTLGREVPRLSNGRHRCQPEVCRAVQRLLREGIHLWRQRQALAIEARSAFHVALRAEPAAGGLAVGDRRRRALGQFHLRPAAQRPEEHGEAGPDRGERDRGLGIGDSRADPLGHAVPKVADRLFGLHQVEKMHGIHP